MKQDDLYSAAEVLSLMGLPVGTQVNAKLTCPKCGKKNKFYMRVDGIKNVGKCWSCGYFCNHTQFYADTYGMDQKDAFKEICERLNIKSFNGDFSEHHERKPIVQSVKNSSVPMAPIDTRHQVYSETIRYFGLSEKHIADMKNRGLTEEEIKKLPYASYNNECTKSLAKYLQAKGLSLESIPGFFQNEQSKKWEARRLKNGILVPYLDVHKRVQGFQLRKDNELLQVRDNGKLEEKCNWFSSINLNKGCGCKTFYHMACDFYYDFATDTFLPFLGKTLYLTEGAMKGDIIHLIEGIPLICVPGVEALTELKALFDSKFLQEQGVEKIVDLYDMDYLSNKYVANAMEKLKTMVAEAEFEYERKTWDTETPNGAVLKGYDDYLAYHKRNI